MYILRRLCLLRPLVPRNHEVYRLLETCWRDDALLNEAFGYNKVFQGEVGGRKKNLRSIDIRLSFWENRFVRIRSLFKRNGT